MKIPSLFSTAARLMVPIMVLSLALFTQPSSQAYSGDADPSLIQRGAINSAIYAVAVDYQGYIWIAGDFTTVYGNAASYIAVLNPDGSFKAAPAWDAFAGGPFPVHALAVDSSSAVYAGGRYGVVRFTALGNISWQEDTNFPNPYFHGAAFISSVNSIAVNSLGIALWVGGPFGIISLSSGGQTNDMYSLPPALVGKYFSQVRYVPITICSTNGGAMDYLLVCGGFGATAILGTGQQAIDNVYFPSLGNHSPTCIAQTLCSSSCVHGDLLVGGTLDAGPTYDYGSFSGSYGYGIWLNRVRGIDAAAYFPGISSATNYPMDQGYGVDVLETFPGGDSLVGGGISRLRGVPVNNFAHLLPDGSVDAAFQNSIGFYPTAMAKQPDGKYVVVGYSLYTPVTGQIARRLAMDDPRPITFARQPTPFDQTVYAGDPIFISASVDAWPPPNLVWVKNGGELISFTQTYLSISPATLSDSGDYLLRARTFCSGNFDSQSAHVTVLPAPPAPGNDMFSQAYLLSGVSAVATGTIRGATLEPGEPDPSSISSGASVWWNWTAPINGNVTLDISASDYSASLNIFTGNALASLTLVTNNCHLVCSDGCRCQGLLPSVSFMASQGTTYRIAVGGAAPVGGLGNILLALAELRSLPSSWSRTTFGSSALNAAAFASGLYLVGGNGGEMAVSPGGLNWTPVSSPIPSNISVWGFDYTRGQFIAVAGGGTIITSPDGTNWVAQASGVDPGLALFSVAHGTNSLSVAVGDSGTVVTSPDGIHWLPRTSGLSSATSLYSVAAGNGLYAAVGDDGTVITSPDGTNWIVAQNAIYTSVLNAICWAKGRFVAVGDSVIVYSADGTNWTQAVGGMTNAMYGLAYGGGYFVAGGQGGAIMTSPDGIKWVSVNSGTTNDLYAVAYSQNGQFLAVGAAGAILLHQPLEIFPPQLLASGLMLFEVSGLEGASVIIEATTSLNPANWQPVATNQVVNGGVSFSDNIISQPSRFYRARFQ